MKNVEDITIDGHMKQHNNAQEQFKWTLQTQANTFSI